MLEPSTSKRAIAMAKAVAHKTFDQFDLNGNSFLNPPEFEDFCRKMFGTGITMERIHEMLSGAFPRGRPVYDGWVVASSPTGLTHPTRATRVHSG